MNVSTPAPRWRRIVKVAIAIAITIIVAPIALMMTFSNLDQGRR